MRRLSTSSRASIPLLRGGELLRDYCVRFSSDRKVGGSVAVRPRGRSWAPCGWTPIQSTVKASPFIFCPSLSGPCFAVLGNSVGGSPHPTAAAVLWGGLPILPRGVSPVSVLAPEEPDTVLLTPPPTADTPSPRGHPTAGRPRGAGCPCSPLPGPVFTNKCARGPWRSLERTSRCLTLILVPVTDLRKVSLGLLTAAPACLP